MIVLVDDLRYFKENVVPVDEDVIVFRNSDDAITWIREQDHIHIHQLWLDHDLGMVNGMEDTTIPFVRELLTRLGDSISVGQFVIHTSNPVGAKNLSAMLSNHKFVIVNARDYFSA